MTLFVSAALLGACGGTSGSGGGGPGCATTVTDTITATGVSIKSICVVPGGSVTFTNADTTMAQHNMAFAGTSCPASTGALSQGASATRTFPTATTCTFSDTLAPTNTALQGTIVVAANPPPGY